VSSRDVLLSSPRLLSAVPVFLQVEGAGNDRVVIEGGDISKAAKPVAARNEATEQSVTVRT
jgi:hypothetical protein